MVKKRSKAAAAAADAQPQPEPVLPATLNRAAQKFVAELDALGASQEITNARQRVEQALGWARQHMGKGKR